MRHETGVKQFFIEASIGTSQTEVTLSISGYAESRKLCLNLCSFNLIKPGLAGNKSCIPKILLERDLIK